MSLLNQESPDPNKTIWGIHLTPPLKKAIPRLLGPLFSQKPHSERTPTDPEYDVG